MLLPRASSSGCSVLQRCSSSTSGASAAAVQHALVAASSSCSSSTRLAAPGSSSLSSSRQQQRTAATAAAAAAAAAAPPGTKLTITTPDDWHLHVRDGDAMRSVVPHSAAVFGRAIIMPNLVPPVTSVKLAKEYESRIRAAVPSPLSSSSSSSVRPGHTFTPLMTLYLTDNTSPDDVAEARAAGIVAYKLYPAGATTNSDSGVTDIARCLPALRAMAELGVLLLVHGEVTDSQVDMFDREAVFIETKLKPLLDQVPSLKVVMEHITTADAAGFVAAAPANVAASVTPQHMLLNRNALFAKGLRPHNYCLPILKRERHREAVAAAATSGSSKFFLGTDSAPHAVATKEASCGCAGVFSAPIALPLYATAFEQAGALDRLEAFASFNGPDFYGLPRNSGTVTLVKQPWTIPEQFGFGSSHVVPMWAGETLGWAVEA